MASLSLLTGFAAPAQAPQENAAALQSDMQWLHLIDAGDYQAAWNSAAPAMQHAVSEQAFANSVGGVRTPLGAAGTRTLLHAEAKTQLPGAPDGHYLVVQYATHFVHKDHAVETVISAQQPNGSWHVAGYFIR